MVSKKIHQTGCVPCKTHFQQPTTAPYYNAALFSTATTPYYDYYDYFTGYSIASTPAFDYDLAMFSTPSPTYGYTTGVYFTTAAYPQGTITEPVPTITESWQDGQRETTGPQYPSIDFVEWKSKDAFLNLDTTGKG